LVTLVGDDEGNGPDLVCTGKVKGQGLEDAKACPEEGGGKGIKID